MTLFRLHAGHSWTNELGMKSTLLAHRLRLMLRPFSLTMTIAPRPVRAAKSRAPEIIQVEAKHRQSQTYGVDHDAPLLPSRA